MTARRVWIVGNLLVFVVVGVLARAGLGGDLLGEIGLGVSVAAGFGVAVLGVAVVLERALHYADRVRATTPPGRAVDARPWPSRTAPPPVPAPRPPAWAVASLGEEEAYARLRPPVVAARAAASSSLSAAAAAPEEVSSPVPSDWELELAPVVPLRRSAAPAPEPVELPPLRLLRPAPPPEVAPPPSPPEPPAPAPRPRRDRQHRDRPRPRLPRRRARLSVVDLAGGGAVRDRDRLLAPLAWPVAPDLSGAEVGAWLGAIAATAGCEAWVTSGAAVVAAAAPALARALGALSDAGVDPAGHAAASALLSSLSERPRTLAAPGTLVGGRLVVAALAPPLTADPAAALLGAVEATALLAASGAVPLLMTRPGSWVLAACAVEETPPAVDATERAALLAADLDDLLVRLGLRPVAPSPRQRDTIAQRTAALVSLAAALRVPEATT